MSLAGRYEPNLILEKEDGFWPVAVRTIDQLRSSQTHTCLAEDAAAACVPAHLRDLPWTSGFADAYLNYPANAGDPDSEHATFVQALKSNAPGTAARMYYYVTGRDPERPVTLQYWFYYPFNYLPGRLFPGVTVNTDLHEGDIEGMSILLSAKDHHPVYVWMPRHRDEGERFAWSEGALQRKDAHPIGYIARGSHATYESCGHKYRTAQVPVFDDNFVPDDTFSCKLDASYELGETIPVLDLARTWWACWPGHLGDAPHNPFPLSELHADGPASPLYQQKFDLRSPQPCEGVDPPSPPEPGQELLADAETAKALGVGGGRLNELFRSCDDWWQRPPKGSYMAACDRATLEAFFESGLEDVGDQNLRIEGDPAARGPMVPAVYAASDPEGVETATIATDGVAHPEVFVAIRDKAKLRIARFPEFTLRPGQRLRMRRVSGERWLLVDLAHRGSKVAEAGVHETEAPTPPSAPSALVARRSGDSIELRFSGGKDPETTFVVYADTSRADLLDGGHAVGAVQSSPDGNYTLTVADPEGRFRYVRVVAFNEGALRASPVVPVADAP